MKKIAFILALVMILVCAAACGEKTSDDTTTTAAGTATAKPSTTTAAPSGGDTTSADGTTAPTTTVADDGDRVEPLIKADRFTVDGKLGEGEWTGLNTVEVKGDENDTKFNSGNKSAVFSAALTESGLYLMVEAYHDKYLYEDNTWWLNTNFEIFISSEANQYFVYGRGINNNAECSTNVDECAMDTQKIDDKTVYHSIAECFISNDNLPEGVLDDDHVLFVGVAWKTAGDPIIGGHCTAGPDGEDEYWVPVEAWPRDVRLLAAPSGLYYMDEYYG